MELVYMMDLKSIAVRHVGSNPTGEIQNPRSLTWPKQHPYKMKIGGSNPPVGIMKLKLDKHYLELWKKNKPKLD